MMNTKEQYLMKEFRRGDTAAIQYVFMAHYRPLCHFAQRLIHHRERAEEIVLDCMTVLIEQRNQFRHLDQVKDYLYKEVLDGCIEMLPALKAYVKGAEPAADSITDWAVVLGNETLLAALQQELYMQVGLLPAAQAKIFSLFFIEKKSLAVISDALDMHEQRIRDLQADTRGRILSGMLKKNLVPYGVVYSFVTTLFEPGN